MEGSRRKRGDSLEDLREKQGGYSLQFCLLICLPLVFIKLPVDIIKVWGWARVEQGRLVFGCGMKFQFKKCFFPTFQLLIYFFVFVLLHGFLLCVSEIEH